MAERLSLTEIEQRAASRGLLLRLQVKQLLAVTTLRVVVARPREGQPPLLLGELKGWALSLPRPRHHHTQGRDRQELFDLQPQQQPPRRGPLLDLRERQPFSHRYQRSTKQTASKGKGP